MSDKQIKDIVDTFGEELEMRLNQGMDSPAQIYTYCKNKGMGIPFNSLHKVMRELGYSLQPDPDCPVCGNTVYRKFK